MPRDVSKIPLVPIKSEDTYPVLSPPTNPKAWKRMWLSIEVGNFWIHPDA